MLWLLLLPALASAVVLTPTQIITRADFVASTPPAMDIITDPNEMVVVANSDSNSLFGTMLAFDPSAVSAVPNGTGYISAYCVLVYLGTTSTARLSTRAAVYTDSLDLLEEEAQINTYNVTYNTGRSPGQTLPSMTDSPVFTFNAASKLSFESYEPATSATAQLLQIPVWVAPWDNAGDVTPIVLIMSSPNEPLTTFSGNLVYCYPNMTLTLVSGSSTASATSSTVSTSTVSTTYQITEPESPEATEHVKDSTTRVLIVTLSLFGGIITVIGLYALYVNSARAHVGRYTPLSS